MPRPIRPPEERFMEKVEKTETCWNWTAARMRIRGQLSYGAFTVRRGSVQLAHRFSYELHVGPIPEGLHIDHLCRNVTCVNPAHLEPVTIAENNRRAPKKGKMTHCRNGHPFDVCGRVDSRGRNRCRICVNDWRRATARAYAPRRKELRETKKQRAL